MVSILDIFVFDTKIIDHESENDVSGHVFEEAGGVGALVISVFEEMDDELVLSYESGVRKSIHSFSDGDHGAAVAKFDVVFDFCGFGDVFFECT